MTNTQLNKQFGEYDNIIIGANVHRTYACHIENCIDPNRTLSLL